MKQFDAVPKKMYPETGYTHAIREMRKLQKETRDKQDEDSEKECEHCKSIGKRRK